MRGLLAELFGCLEEWGIPLGLSDLRVPSKSLLPSAGARLGMEE